MEHGARGALESVWIQRLKSSSRNPYTKASAQELRSVSKDCCMNENQPTRGESGTEPWKWGKGSLWICQTEGHMRAVVPQAKRGISSSSAAAKETMISRSCEQKGKAVDTSWDGRESDRGRGSQAVAGFGPLWTSFNRPPRPPPASWFPPPTAASTDKAMLCRLNDYSDGEATLINVSSVADEGQNSGANVAYKEQLLKERADEKKLSALSFNLRSYELNFVEQLEKPQSSRARHHTFPSTTGQHFVAENYFASKLRKRSLLENLKPKAIEDLPRQLVLSKRSQELKSFPLELPEFWPKRDISSPSFPCTQSLARYSDLKYKQNADQLTPKNEENGARASISQRTKSRDMNSVSGSSPNSVVQLLSSAHEVRASLCSPSTVALPSEALKLSAWNYGAQFPPVMEVGSLAGAARFPKQNADRSLNQHLARFEERSEMRQHKEAQLDMNLSVCSSEKEEEEGHTPSRRLHFENIEADISPVCQQTRHQKFIHSRPYALSSTMNDKQACGLFPSSAKRSRPDEHGAMALLKAAAHMHAATEGEEEEDEAKKCGLVSHHSWLQRWISQPCKSNLYKPRENAKNETFGSCSLQMIPRGRAAFLKMWSDSFQPKTNTPSALQENTTPCRPAPSAVQFSTYCAPCSKEYNTSSAAAVALDGTLIKQGHSSSARSKGFLEVFPSAGMQHSSFRRHSLEVHIDPQARYVVQSREHSNSSS